MATSLAILIGVLLALAAITHLRAARREAAAEAAAPPIGQFIDVDGTRIHALVRGTGPDLVMLHGASGNLRDFLPLIDRLATQFRVVAFDRPGQGWSAPAQRSVTLSDQSDILTKAALALGVMNPILMGQSYGGAVALAWALQDRARPRALVLVSAPSLPWKGALDIWYRLNETRLGAWIAPHLVTAFVPNSHIDGLLTNVFRPQPEPESYGKMIGVGLSLRRAALRINAAQVNALLQDVTTLSPHYPRLTMPVELIHGEDDHIVPFVLHSKPLKSRLPDATLTVLPTGHMPHHSHPDVVIDAIHRAAARSQLR